MTKFVFIITGVIMWAASTPALADGPDDFIKLDGRVDLACPDTSKDLRLLSPGAIVLQGCAGFAIGEKVVYRDAAQDELSMVETTSMDSSNSLGVGLHPRLDVHISVGGPSRAHVELSDRTHVINRVGLDDMKMTLRVKLPSELLAWLLDKRMNLMLINSTSSARGASWVDNGNLLANELMLRGDMPVPRLSYLRVGWSVAMEHGQLTTGRNGAAIEDRINLGANMSFDVAPSSTERLRLDLNYLGSVPLGRDAHEDIERQEVGVTLLIELEEKFAFGFGANYARIQVVDEDSVRGFVLLRYHVSSGN